MRHLNIRALEKLRKSRNRKKSISSYMLVRMVWIEYIGADGILRRLCLQIHDSEPRIVSNPSIDIIERGKGYVIYRFGSSRKYVRISLYGNHDEGTVKRAYSRYLAVTGGGKILEIRFESQRERK